jgi:hypothetical protein
VGDVLRSDDRRCSHDGGSRFDDNYERRVQRRSSISDAESRPHSPVQNKLKKIGLSKEEIVPFTGNSAIPLSLQVSAVRDLDALGNIPGRRAAAVELGNMMTEYQARFIVTSLHMLDQWSQQNSPITRIWVPGVLVARDQNGVAIMPAPVDYVSWTQRIAGFATAPSLLALQNRVLWITGKMTPLARERLAANGCLSTIPPVGIELSLWCLHCFQSLACLKNPFEIAASLPSTGPLKDNCLRKEGVEGDSTTPETEGLY